MFASCKYVSKVNFNERENNCLSLEDIVSMWSEKWHMLKIKTRFLTNTAVRIQAQNMISFKI